jgi:predicted nucleic acid-binding protein
MVACSLHGRAEAIAALRQFREGTLTRAAFGHVLDQFESDCENQGHRWLPALSVVIDQLQKSIETPSSVFLRASDALHLANASTVSGDLFNDQSLLDAAEHFAVKA